MRTFGRFLGRSLLVLVLASLALWIFGPYERISVVPSHDPAAIGADVEAYLAAQEAEISDITPGTEKRVIWYDEPGTKTPLSIVYVHGFSATSEEIRPVPDMVARELGANLHYTRLAGHGRPGGALAKARAQEWMTDMAEALEIGRRIGDEVIVISTSTGATLAAEAALQPAMMERVKGLVMISPNFRINDPTAGVLTMPAARYWVPVAAGKTRSWEGQNEGHNTYWTTTYPTEALFQMAALVQHSVAQDYGAATHPVLFWFSDADGVVDHAATREIAGQWGGPVTLEARTLGEGDDPYNHVIAGDILSPGQTQITTVNIINWINNLT
ncbi:alpha/beta fold hydrolase [uncultured Shimia sp.]|uniref:alpha/beta hydrolase n=1 Tax=uncultured Shimia sp. TaxID=573152 RepID=UPI00262B6489|nr:alpha/beta fold hydrolase [uncultured Shimia sp.]